MSVEITGIRTAAETATAIHSTTPADLAGLDPRTLAAVTQMLKAAADLTRAQRPIVLHQTSAPAPHAVPFPAPIHVRIPAPQDTHMPAPPRRGRLYTRAEAAFIASAVSTLASATGVALTANHALAALALGSALGIFASGAAIVTTEGHR